MSNQPDASHLAVTYFKLVFATFPSDAQPQPHHGVMKTADEEQSGYSHVRDLRAEPRPTSAQLGEPSPVASQNS